MKRLPSIIFSIIWIFMAFIFLYLAIQAKELESTKLSIYALKLPSDWVPQGSISVAGVINDIAKSHNENVAILEESIHQSARTSFWLNLLSFFLAVLGFGTQVYILKNQKEHNNRKTYTEPEKNMDAPIKDNK